MLFVDKKETFFDYNNKNFSKSQKSPFAKGITHVLVKKMPMALFRFDQNKTRNNA